MNFDFEYRTIRLCIVPFLIFLLIQSNNSMAQEREPLYLIRLYEDNDFLNITGNGTDNAYTNGTSLNFFYSKQKPSRFFIDKWLPKAGKYAINIFNWELMQLMITPDDISKTTFQPNDYSYAGVLFASHGLHSYNALKKYVFTTELLAGIRGPASFAEAGQKFIHKLIGYQQPMGWDNQLRTSLLININFGAEKKLLAIGHFMELIGGTKLSAGNFQDAVSIYPLLRIGKMSPYFDGLLKQFGSYTGNNKKVNTQFYLIVKPAATWVLHDALLHGKTKNNRDSSQVLPVTVRQIRHRVLDIQYGFILALRRFSISYLQTHSTEYNKGLYHHNYGNISVSFRW